MKKLLALLLTCILVLTSVSAVWAEETAGQDNDELVVAVTTPLTGNFFTSLWGNGTSDQDVRALIHGYSLVEWKTENGVFVPNSAVVNGINIEQGGNGDIVILLSLYRDLCYSDGSPITAWDYAFSILLTMAPEMEELGGNIIRPEFISGYKSYASGKTNKLSGVRVLADNLLQVTIDGAYLPFFYQLGLLDYVPYPISEIAPGVKVADDGQGVYLTNKEAFTAEALKGTILDEATGYKTHPAVTSGAYILKSYADGAAEFEINEQFKGDANWKKPTIRKIKMVSMGSDEMAAALKDGKVTILNKVSDQQTIADCKELTEGEGNIAAAEYPRNGLSFINFNTDRAPLDDVNVRQAIAYAADRDEIATETAGETGEKAKGYFGMGQWMYLLLSGAVSPVEEPAEDADAKTKKAYEDQMKAWEKVSLDDIEAYDRNLEKAAELLDKAGWNLNENGEAYTAGTDKIRYKKAEDGLKALQLSLAYGQGSAAGRALEGALVESLAEAGIEVKAEAIPADQLLSQFYRQSETEYDMLFLATNFELVYDPSVNFTTTEDGHHGWRFSGLQDDELWRLAVAMRKTQPGDLLGFCTRWLQFQKKFMDQLPVLPIYTNNYFDYYPAALQGYDIGANISWPQTIIGATMAE